MNNRSKNEGKKTGTKTAAALQRKNSSPKKSQKKKMPTPNPINDHQSNNQHEVYLSSIPNHGHLYTTGHQLYYEPTTATTFYAHPSQFHVMQPITMYPYPQHSASPIVHQPSMPLPTCSTPITISGDITSLIRPNKDTMVKEEEPDMMSDETFHVFEEVIQQKAPQQHMLNETTDSLFLHQQQEMPSRTPSPSTEIDEYANKIASSNLVVGSFNRDVHDASSFFNYLNF